MNRCELCRNRSHQELHLQWFLNAYVKSRIYGICDWCVMNVPVADRRAWLWPEEERIKSRFEDALKRKNRPPKIHAEPISSTMDFSKDPFAEQNEVVHWADV